MGATCHAESRADFIHKVSLATKELGETLYWLRLIARARLLPTLPEGLLVEIDQPDRDPHRVRADRARQVATVPHSPFPSHIPHSSSPGEWEGLDVLAK